MEVNPSSEVTTKNELDQQPKQQQTYQTNSQQQNEQKNDNKNHTNLVDRQESLDVYNELKMQESKKQSQSSNLAASQEIVKQPKNLISLVSFEDQQFMPSVNLQPSPKSHKPVKIEILSYRTTTFMGMSTQIFNLKIIDQNTSKCYQIQRRFSDFVDLYDQLFNNHPGYILYPFPDKTLDSFVKLKLGLTVQIGQKNQLIQKRMKQLQQFVLWVAQHSQLRNSQQFTSFIASQEKKYEQAKNRLNKYVSEYKSLQSGSHLKNIIEAGKSIFNHYFKSSTQKQASSPKINAEGEYDTQKGRQKYQKIIQEKERLSKMIDQCHLLLQAEKSFSQFYGMDTDNDILLKLCAKHASGREYCKNFANFLEISTIQNLDKNFRRLQQAQKSLIHRVQIIENILAAKQALDLDKKAKLQRRLERSVRNFQVDWAQFYKQTKKEVMAQAQKFNHQWLIFKNQMKKIWKQK